MNEGFRQRLVGAVVLTCLALIAWPIVFSDVSNPVVDRRSQIPPMPVFEKYSIEQPTRPKDIDPVPDAEIELANDVQLADIAPEESVISNEVVDGSETAIATLDADEPVVAAVDEKPSLDDRGIPASWVLQVASFSQEKNANELKLKLQQQGYKAYTRKINTTNGSATRVYIGPRLTKQALLDDKPVIDSMFNVNSLVISFKP